PLLAPPGAVGALTGGSLLVMYAVAFWGPLAGGLLWDRFGQPGLVFLPVAVASLLLVVLGPLLPHHEPHSDSPRAALPGPAAPLSRAPPRRSRPFGTWSSVIRTVRATRYVMPLREGGSLPAIVEADDDGLYVVKFRGAGQGPKALVAELIAGEIGRALGLP